MSKTVKKSTLVFLAAIVGVVALFAAVYFGFMVKENADTTVDETDRYATSEVLGAETDEPLTDEELAAINASHGADPASPKPAEVTIATDASVDTAESEGITTRTFESGGMVTIALEEFEGTMRESVSIVDEKPVKVAGKDGSFVSAKSAKDGTALSIIFVKDGGLIYLFEGSEAFLESVQESAEFSYN